MPRTLTYCSSHSELGVNVLSGRLIQYPLCVCVYVCGVVVVCVHVVNPRRACAARVTVVVLCVCVCVCVCVCQCVQAAHLRLTQLSDKLDILTDLVSWWLQN